MCRSADVHLCPKVGGGHFCHTKVRPVEEWVETQSVGKLRHDMDSVVPS